MYLPDFLFVKLVQQPVILFFVFVFHVGQAVDLHGVVNHHESAFQFERPYFAEIEQRFLHIADGAFRCVHPDTF